MINAIKALLGFEVHEKFDENQVYVIFTPQKDITAWELLHISPSIMCNLHKKINRRTLCSKEFWNNLPDEVKRHFHVVSYETFLKTKQMKD